MTEPKKPMGTCPGKPIVFVVLSECTKGKHKHCCAAVQLRDRNAYWMEVCSCDCHVSSDGRKAPQSPAPLEYECPLHPSQRQADCACEVKCKETCSVWATGNCDCGRVPQLSPQPLGVRERLARVLENRGIALVGPVVEDILREFPGLSESAPPALDVEGDAPALKTCAFCPQALLPQWKFCHMCGKRQPDLRGDAPVINSGQVAGISDRYTQAKETKP